MARPPPGFLDADGEPRADALFGWKELLELVLREDPRVFPIHVLLQRSRAPGLETPDGEQR
jgi:hypothetical protein